MFGIFGDVKSLVKLDDICIDNNIFRLHYKVSSSTVSAASIITISTSPIIIKI